MNGIPSTKMGGIPSPVPHYGDKQRNFRYYKISIPDGRRGVSGLQAHGALQDTGGLYALYFAEKVNGPNLISVSTPISGNVNSSTEIAAWLLDRDALPDSSILYLETPNGMTSEYVIDFGYSLFIENYSLCMRNCTAGWRLYGSNNGSAWSLINEILPDPEIIKRETPHGIQWYPVKTLTGRVMAKEDRPYKNWGLVFGESTGLWFYNSTYNNRNTIREVSFLDGAGGTNLSVGGTPNKQVAPYSVTDVSPLFDGVTTGTVYMFLGMGVSYEFTSPVSPAVLAIAGGSDLYNSPMRVMVMCSDNEYNWVHSKTIYMPYGTWQDYSVTTEEFNI